MRPVTVSALALLIPFTAFADCTDPQSPQERATCAALALREADDALNAQWPLTKAHFRQVDRNIDALPAEWRRPERSAVELLVEAQRAWIRHRDADCAARSAGATGLEFDAKVSYCKAYKTTGRTEELQRLREEGPAPTDQEFAVLVDTLPECQDQSSTAATNRCLAKVYNVADGFLNDTYRAVVRRVGANARAMLVEAQREWIQVRDQTCEAEVRASWGGTGYGGFLSACLAHATFGRTGELKRLYPESSGE